MRARIPAHARAARARAARAPAGALRRSAAPLLQSSANLSGGPDARALGEVPAAIRDGADLVLDGGELPGVASTVLDLRDYAALGTLAGRARGRRSGSAEIARASPRATDAAPRAACVCASVRAGACDAVRGSMAHPTELDALYAFLVAAAVTALLTPLTMRFARAVGAIDEPRERGLSERPTPLLGGLAIFAGVLVAGSSCCRRLRRRAQPVARRADRAPP